MFLKSGKISDPVVSKTDAIKIVGSCARLSRLLGISRASVSAWDDIVPPLQAYRLIQIYPELNNSKNSEPLTDRSNVCGPL